MPRLAMVALGLAVLSGCATTGAASRAAPEPRSPLLAPDVRELLSPAPDSFTVAMETTKGMIVLTVHRAWSPRGADRFHYLVTHGFYDGARFYRVVSGFMAQFGFNGTPAVDSLWRELPIRDDQVRESNRRGLVTFATSGPNTRTTQLFINLADNARLDGLGFAPFARVASGMEVVDSLHAGYGEGPPQGRGPEQGRIAAEGNTYLMREFEALDYVRSARVIWRTEGPRLSQLP